MAQIQKGFTYSAGSPTNQVTFTNLNAHVDDAILLPGAITEQTAVTATETVDLVLVYDDSAAALKKVALSNLLYGAQVTLANLETDFIADATAKVTPVAADLVLIGDSEASNATKKSTITQLSTPLAPLVSTAILASDFVADATAKATPVAADLLLIGDSEASNVCKKATITQLAPIIATAISASATVSYTSSNQALPGNAGVVTLAHSLGDQPRFVRWVLVCTTTDLGYAVDDEVDLWAADQNSPQGRPAFNTVANATNLICQQASLDSDTILLLRRDGSVGDSAAITPGSWRLKVYASL